MTGSRVARRVVARGEVQGVYFRDSTRSRAQELGVAGWVRNRGDGSVEALFEGDPDAVARMVDFCRSGPGRADVSGLEVDEREPQGLDGFEVR